MPIHDWSRVRAGTFHDFHATWIPLLKNELNRGILPKGYYAMAEQIAGGIMPDVITLQMAGDGEDDDTDFEGGGTAVQTKPPQVSCSATLEPRMYATKVNRLVIRHSSNDRVVALVEVLSPGNKAGQREMDAFIENAWEAIHAGIHLLVIDLHRPTRRDPQGIHGLIWESLGDDSYVAPPNKPLTLASYVGCPEFRAYFEPLAVGDVLPPMPLYLGSRRYVNVPLEESYMQAVSEIPEPARKPLEA